jgi:hypothetical protein
MPGLSNLTSVERPRGLSMKSHTVMTLSMILSACASPLPVLEAGPRASDPNAPVPRLRHAAVTAATKDYQPVDAKAWTEPSSGTVPQQENSGGAEQKSDEESKSDAEVAPAQEAQ